MHSIGQPPDVACPWLSLRPLWDRASAAWFVYSGDGRLRYANPALEQLMGAIPTIGTTDVIPSVIPENRMAYARLLLRLRTGPVGGEASANVVVVGGSQPRLARIHLVGVPDARSTGNALIGMVQDALEGEVDDDGAAERLNRMKSSLARIAVDLSTLIPQAPTGVASQRLSPRQQQIVELLSEGHRPAAIARMLHLSVHTVRNHTKTIFTQLGVHSQTELIARYRAIRATSHEAATTESQ